jgi:small-conductance mechanosensitive channel
VQNLSDLFSGFSGFTDIQLRIVETSAVILLLTLSRWGLLLLLRRRSDDVRVRYRWRKVITYTTGVLGIIVVGRIWFVGVGSIATFLGLVAAGIAVALKDPLTNLAGWLFILWRRPFTAGDRVQVGDHRGDVIDLRLFQFTLLEIGNWVQADQSTGRLLHIPNGFVFTLPLANYKRKFSHIWNEIPVLVTFESDWKLAKKILLDIANTHAARLSETAERQILDASRSYMIFYSTLKPTVYTSVENSGVLLTIRYLCEARQRRGTTQAIWESILDAFADQGSIDFAYPTTRFYDNAGEGKKPLRPPQEPG